MNAVTAKSPAVSEQVSSSGRTRFQAAQPQPAIDQGQNQIQAQVAPTKSGEPAVASLGKVSPIGLRGSRGVVTGSQVEPGNHSVQSQTGSQAGDASTLVRDSAGTHGAMSAISGNAGGSTGAPTRSAAHETFAALDADTQTGTPSWIHAGARHAEAGFQDPALGWVGVRADASGGAVHATLMPGSAEAAQTLGGHMAGLNAYLAEEHTPVETLTLAMPEGREAGLDDGQNAGQGMNQGAGQNSPSESQSNSKPVMSAIAAAVPREIPELTDNLGRAVGNPTYESAHISVMA
jgi:hypothetical protein